MGFAGKNSKESVHLRINKELFDRLEKLRKQKHSEVLLPRGTVYEETLFYGEKIQMLKKELGESEFERIWHWLNKLNLKKINIEKIL